MSDDKKNQVDLAWSNWAATNIVDELVTGGVISLDKVALAEAIVAQQLHVLLASGWGPDNPRFSS
jgi:hypothetical protein